MVLPPTLCTGLGIFSWDPGGMDESPRDVEHLAATLRARREEMVGASGARIGDSEIVHQLTTRMWVGVEVPAVVCAAAGDPLRLRPAQEPVTCRRCRTRGRGAEAEQVEGQQRLL